MKCIHCQTEIFWNSTELRWDDRVSVMCQQYCWIDPELGSQLHKPQSEVPLTPEQVAIVALRTIATYPTKSTDASVLALQRIANDALKKSL